MEQINWNKVREYLNNQIANLPKAPMQVKKFSEGYSNLTFLLKIGEWEAVLRRPPFGEIPPKAHDMEREYRILAKINPVFPLAPQPYVYCDDSSVMEKHFYVMEKKKGIVIDDVLPINYEKTEETGKSISNAVVSTLVQLHSVDIEKEDLIVLGKPEGYLERQVHGWIKRYNASKIHELSGIKEIEKWLLDHIPTSPKSTIVHNDFKLNNMMLDGNDPSKAVAVFDWELSTVGDPLTDLGSAVSYWADELDKYTGLTSITTNPGFITRREFVEQYAMQSGRDVSEINYYLTYAFYKISSILQQIYYRWKKGELDDDRFSNLDQGIQNLMDMAHRAKNNQLL
ncbi:phosphotransferase family protein [Peribacillus frigoritolerans]|uniref:phosphotransferase family protein n=1 Tax=Peribacillus frigoritolerans TaxID=450367 RepID=UPI003D2C9104